MIFQTHHHLWSPWTNSPKIFGPHGQMVPKTIGPQNLLAVSKSIMEPFFMILSLSPKKIYLRFGKSLLFVFVQKHFFHFYFELEMVFLSRK